MYTAILFTSRNLSRITEHTAQPIVGKDQYNNKQLKDHFHDEYLQFFRMPRPRSGGAIVKLIEFEYFLGRRPSEIIKTNPQLKKTTVYQICKTLEWWGVPYPAQRLSIWGRPRKMTQEMVDSLVQLLAVWSTYFLNELQYYILSTYQLWVSESTISYTIKEVAFTRKVKQRIAAQRNEIKHGRWYMNLKRWSPKMLVFVDESAANKRTLDRRYSWPPQGKVYQ